jgi:hypothetical protein
VDDKDELRQRVSYTGEPAFSHILVRLLEEEGVRVRYWDPPRKRRSVQDVAQGVVVTLIATGTTVAVESAVTRFRMGSSGRPDVTIAPDPGDDVPTTTGSY